VPAEKALAGSRFPWLSVDDLCQRFTHSDLYETREEIPRDTALMELRARGLLHRGMSALKVGRSSGGLSQRPSATPVGDRPDRIWLYHLHASALTVEFSPKGEVLFFEEEGEGEQPKIDRW
jgi:hypothetical protein